MDRRRFGPDGIFFCVPRKRGDGPGFQVRHIDVYECSPQARGWTGGRNHGRGKEGVFPASAGMDRSVNI